MSVNFNIKLPTKVMYKALFKKDIPLRAKVIGVVLGAGYALVLFAVAFAITALGVRWLST